VTQPVVLVPPPAPLLEVVVALEVAVVLEVDADVLEAVALDALEEAPPSPVDVEDAAPPLPPTSATSVPPQAIDEAAAASSARVTIDEARGVRMLATIGEVRASWFVGAPFR